MSFQGLEFSGDTEPNSRQFPPVGTGQEQLLSDVSKAQEQLKDPVGWAPRWPVPKSSRLIPKLAGNRQRFPHVWSSEIRTPRRIWSRKNRSWLPALRHTGDFGFWTVPVLWFFLCFSRFLFFFWEIRFWMLLLTMKDQPEMLELGIIGRDLGDASWGRCSCEDLPIKEGGRWWPWGLEVEDESGRSFIPSYTPPFFRPSNEYIQNTYWTRGSFHVKRMGFALQQGFTFRAEKEQKTRRGMGL